MKNWWINGDNVTSHRRCPCAVVQNGQFSKRGPHCYRREQFVVLKHIQLPIWKYETRTINTFLGIFRTQIKKRHIRTTRAGGRMRWQVRFIQSLNTVVKLIIRCFWLQHLINIFTRWWFPHLLDMKYQQTCRYIFCVWQRLTPAVSWPFNSSNMWLTRQINNISRNSCSPLPNKNKWINNNTCPSLPRHIL